MTRKDLYFALAHSSEMGLDASFDSIVNRQLIVKVKYASDMTLVKFPLDGNVRDLIKLIKAKYAKMVLS